MPGTAAQMLCPIRDETQVGAARRRVQQVAETASLGDVMTGHAAIVATELASNMLRHAGGGDLLVQSVDEFSFRGLELLAVDRGPGIRDVRLSLQDGHSTRGTPGTGLGAARRLSTIFDLFSEPARGTIVLSRIGSLRRNGTSLPQCGAVSTSAPGEAVSGDQWAITCKDDLLSLMVVDGLGHGVLAHEAAAQAVRVFIEHSTEQPANILERMHQALRNGRGAAIAVARCNLNSGEVIYAGIGNVAGVLVRADGQQNGLVSNNGTVGADHISVKEFRYEWKPGEAFVMHSDGLQTRWSMRDRPGLAACHPAIIAALLHRDYLRGRDDATIVVLSR
jgi:anti-sigma regulatory factor (Ser/Thr protein kinase)